MAFPNSKPSMPPPGAAPKPDVVIGIGAGPKKPGGAPDESESPDKGQHKLEAAGVVRADKHCNSCENYVPESGECNELPGSFDPDDACVKYYEAMGDSSDPNETDESEGEMPPPEPVSAGANA